MLLMIKSKIKDSGEMLAKEILMVKLAMRSKSKIRIKKHNILKLEVKINININMR